MEPVVLVPESVSSVTQLVVPVFALDASRINMTLDVPLVWFTFFCTVKRYGLTNVAKVIVSISVFVMVPVIAVGAYVTGATNAARSSVNEKSKSPEKMAKKPKINLFRIVEIIFKAI